MSRLTNWELGQELIRMSDCMGEVLVEIQDQLPGNFIMSMHEARGLIGDELENIGSHDFGIYNSESYREETN